MFSKNTNKRVQVILAKLSTTATKLRSDIKNNKYKINREVLVSYTIVIFSLLFIFQFALFSGNQTSAATIQSSKGIWCRGAVEDPIPGYTDIDEGVCVVPSNEEDKENFDLCKESSQFGTVTLCAGGFDDSGQCLGESEEIQALNIGDKASCKAIANEHCASVSIDIQCSANDTDSNTSIGNVMCDPDPNCKAAKGTATQAKIEVDTLESSSKLNAIAQPAAYWGSCSNSCGSGAECNKYGTPPEGTMFSCISGGCYDVAINSAYPGRPAGQCYLSCASGQWESCGCDVAQCEAQCEQIHANDAPGHYTHTMLCSGCQQEFTCGCDIEPPVTTPPVITTPPVTTIVPSCPFDPVDVEYSVINADGSVNSEWNAAEGVWGSGSDLTGFLNGRDISTLRLDINCFANNGGGLVDPANFTISGPGITNGGGNGSDGELRGVVINLPTTGGSYSASCQSVEFPNDPQCGNSDGFSVNAVPTTPPVTTPPVTTPPVTTPPVTTPPVTETPECPFAPVNVQFRLSEWDYWVSGDDFTDYFAENRYTPINFEVNCFANDGGALVDPANFLITGPGITNYGGDGSDGELRNVSVNVSQSGGAWTAECQAVEYPDDPACGDSDSFSIAPEEGETPPVKVSGEVYCQDEGSEDKYMIGGANVLVYDQDGTPYNVITDEEGKYETFVSLVEATEGFSNNIGVMLHAFDSNNDQTIDATGQSYSEMIPPSASLADFALNCADTSVTHCQVPAGLPSCGTASMNNSSSYANCGITTHEDEPDLYSEFDFRFRNCAPVENSPTPTPSEEPDKDLDVTKIVIEDDDSIYNVGNTVKFKITIRNTGDTILEQIEFSDEYNQARLDFTVMRDAKTGNNITNAFEELGSIDETLGIFEHPDLTELNGFEDLEPGETIELVFEFKALIPTSLTCNDVVIKEDDEEDIAEACVTIIRDIPETDL